MSPELTEACRRLGDSIPTEEDVRRIVREEVARALATTTERGRYSA